METIKTIILTVIAIVVCVYVIGLITIFFCVIIASHADIKPRGVSIINKKTKDESSIKN